MENTRELTRLVKDPYKAGPTETLLLRKRNHWYVLVQPLGLATLVLLTTILLISFFFSQFFNDLLLFIVILSIAVMIHINAVIKILVDWYCHFYVLTSRRIMEISYEPLFSKDMNNIIISQVKATEIDVEMEGILAQMLNIGSVIVTFDRPTHQQEFWMHNIEDPKSVGFLLAERLDLGRKYATESPIWVRTRNNEKRFGFRDDVFPDESVGLT